MELEEHGHKDSDDPIEHVGHLDNKVLNQLFLVFGMSCEVVGVEGPLDAFNPGEGHSEGNVVGEE